MVERQQTITSDMVMQGLALAIFVLLLAVLIALISMYQIRYSDPYIRKVLTLNGDAVQGHAIFQMNCATCHGTYAGGLVGPDLHNISDRKSRGRSN